MSPKSRNLREAPSGKRGTGPRRGGGRGRRAADTRGSAKANAAGVNRAERRARPSSPALIAQTTSGEWTNTPVRWCPLNSPNAALMGGAPIIPCDAAELGGSTAKAFFPLRAACQALWFTGKRPTRFCAGAVTSRDGDSWDGDWGDASGSGSVFQLSEPIRYRAYKWGFRVDNSESLHPFRSLSRDGGVQIERATPSPPGRPFLKKKRNRDGHQWLY